MMTGWALLTALALGSGQQAPERVSVDPPESTVSVGGEVMLSATVLDGTGAALAGLSVFWLTTTPDVVAVDQSGRVTGVGHGEARVGARAGNTVGFARITVLPPPPSEIRATLPQTTIPAGFSIPLSVTALDGSGEVMRDTPLIFASADPDVAHVDEEGRIWGRMPGQTSVTISAGPTSATVPVRISDAVAGRGYSLEPSGRTVRTGDVVRFRVSGVEAYPAWSVDGTGAQIGDEGRDGVFVAERPGRYRITALIGESAAATGFITVEQRLDEAELVKVGRGAAAEHHSGDTWVFEGE
ncbi:MAG: Ig-like domain-containing protein, partial [Gemmatimonadota bacterium]|nr:Ig-like domain-containing protein [Gemmatimonadota bacterium]